MTNIVIRTIRSCICPLSLSLACPFLHYVYRFITLRRRSILWRSPLP